jgi:hypothetical protein
MVNRKNNARRERSLWFTLRFTLTAFLPFLLPLLVAVSGCRFRLPFGMTESVYVKISPGFESRRFDFCRPRLTAKPRSLTNEYPILSPQPTLQALPTPHSSLNTIHC